MKLKTLLEPQRTTTNLYLELYSSNQNPDEDLTTYSTRIELVLAEPYPGTRN